MPEPVNGDRVVVRYGDEIVPLDERLARQDREILWIRRTLYGLGALLVLHVLLPGEDMLTFILNLLGF